jgi:glyoxylase-like metal-dependent hydrolase (beta-lactamase superfamily II)
VLFVVTARSVVVIDTTEGVQGASAALAELRKICPLPVSYIIYTHHHTDHLGGARVFHAPGTQIIAHRSLPEELAKMNRLRASRRRRRESHPQDAVAGTPEPPDDSEEAPALDGYVPPDILFDDRHCFEEGGVVLELSHAPGETVDHLAVWLPEQRVLFPGDLFTNSFPMLGTPMYPDQPVHAWVKSLERLRALRARYLVPSRSRPLAGAKEIGETLGHYLQAIRFVHDETVQGINQGRPLEELRRRVRLPAKLASLPCLQERYGTVAWAVNAIFHHYLGWYTLHPRDLRPSPRDELCTALLETCGGSAALLGRAQQALEQGSGQLALELADIVLAAAPHDGPALALRTEALQRLTDTVQSSVARNTYRAALRLVPRHKPAEYPPGEAVVPLAPQTTHSTPDSSTGDTAMAAAKALDPSSSGLPSPNGNVAGPAIINDPIFLLAPPLSFAALVGGVLGRHPQTYGLPETHLLGYERVVEWWTNSMQASFAMGHGLLRAVAQLIYGEQTEAAVALANGWLRRRLHLTTGAVLEALAERVHPAFLVEKSPSIVYSLDSMKRAFEMFPDARFIHLLRHPRGHGEAVLAAIQEAAEQEPLPASHWLLHLSSFPPVPATAGEDPEWGPTEDSSTPQAGMEKILQASRQDTALPEGILDPQWGWYALNRNIADFLADVPKPQVFRIRGEDLLADPDKVLTKLTAALGLRSDAVAIHHMKHPERSPYACWGPPSATFGDEIAFLKDPLLRPHRAAPLSLEGPLAWRADGRGFARAVRRLAQEFGYL